MGKSNSPLRFKEGVDIMDVHPLIWTYAYTIAKAHLAWTGYRMVITSMTRIPELAAPVKSYHNPMYAAEQHLLDRHLSTAFDMRRWYFKDFQDLQDFCLYIKETMDIGCLIEPEWMTPSQIAARGGLDKIAPHVHWQLSTRNSMWLDESGQLIL